MSLDYDLRNLDDDLRKQFFPPDALGLMNDHLHVAIFATMTVDIGYLKDIETADEFYYRLHLWQTNVGPLFNRIVGDSDPLPILLSREVCRALVGLRTNVNNTTRAVWFKNRFIPATEQVLIPKEHTS